MLGCKDFYECLRNNGIEFYAGVPDSVLKYFCAYVAEHADPTSHVITANEGAAIALCCGYHLASGRIAVVYMQNSGQGNAINPLTSLVDREVYSIPMLLLIGWRGEPGQKDEPQHVKQGRITLDLFKTLGIPYEILPDQMAAGTRVVRHAVNTSRSEKVPFALIVRRGTFDQYGINDVNRSEHPLVREEAITLILDTLQARDVVVATTGKTSREVFEGTVRRESLRRQTFLMVGSMGHASQIALGVALKEPDRQVYCIDGDGAVIMHMGSLAVIGGQRPRNLKHIVINNGAHDSVGGQPTVGFQIDIPAIARACQYTNAWRSQTTEESRFGLSKLRSAEGPALLEIRVRKGARSELGRPTATPHQNKHAFMEFLQRPNDE